MENFLKNFKIEWVCIFCGCGVMWCIVMMISCYDNFFSVCVFWYFLWGYIENYYLILENELVVNLIIMVDGLFYCFFMFVLNLFIGFWVFVGNNESLSFYIGFEGKYKV